MSDPITRLLQAEEEIQANRELIRVLRDMVEARDEHSAKINAELEETRKNLNSWRNAHEVITNYESSSLGKAHAKIQELLTKLAIAEDTLEFYAYNFTELPKWYVNTENGPNVARATIAKLKN